MTPKEKAIQLFQMYNTLGKDFTRGVSMKEFAKECALICCDEVLGHMGADRGAYFWAEVKEELKKL